MLATQIKFESRGVSLVHNFGSHLLSFDHTPEGWGEIEGDDATTERQDVPASFDDDELAPLDFDDIIADEPADVCEGQPKYGLGLADSYRSDRDKLMAEIADADLAGWDYTEAMARHRRFYREGFIAASEADSPVEPPAGLDADDRYSWLDGASVGAGVAHVRIAVEAEARRLRIVEETVAMQDAVESGSWLW